MYEVKRLSAITVGFRLVSFVGGTASEDDIRNHQDQKEEEQAGQSLRALLKEALRSAPTPSPLLRVDVDDDVKSSGTFCDQSLAQNGPRVVPIQIAQTTTTTHNVAASQALTVGDKAYALRIVLEIHSNDKDAVCVGGGPRHDKRSSVCVDVHLGAEHEKDENDFAAAIEAFVSHYHQKLQQQQKQKSNDPSKDGNANSSNNALPSSPKHSLAEEVQRASRHPFLFAPKTIATPNSPASSKTNSGGASACAEAPNNKNDADGDEKVNIIDFKPLYSTLATVIYQAIFSLNVRRVQEEISGAVLGAAKASTEAVTSGHTGLGSGAQPSTGSKPLSLLIPLSSFGPALLLATRACSRPLSSTECVSTITPQFPAASQERSGDTKKETPLHSDVAAGLCPGMCGNPSHDLITRAYMRGEDAIVGNGGDEPINNNEKEKKKPSVSIIAVEIPLPRSTAAAVSLDSEEVKGTEKTASSPRPYTVVSYERDYLFGIVHSGRRRRTCETLLPNTCYHVSLSDIVAGGAASIIGSAVRNSSNSSKGGLAVNRTKGYALQTHVKGLNYVMRMADTNNNNVVSTGNTNSDYENHKTKSYAYSLGCCALATAALASRESSTHANQYVPAGGVEIQPPGALFGGSGGTVRAKEAKHNTEATAVTAVGTEKGCESEGKKEGQASEGGSESNQRDVATAAAYVLDYDHAPLAITRGGHTGISTGALSATANPLSQKALCFDVIGRLVEVFENNSDDECESVARHKVVYSTPLSTLDFVRPPNNTNAKGTNTDNPTFAASNATADAVVSTEQQRTSLRQVANMNLRTPIIVISGTSAEAGKSTLAKKIMVALQQCDADAFKRKVISEEEMLSKKNKKTENIEKEEITAGGGTEGAQPNACAAPKRKLRVAYVKATGTSSWGDTIHAQKVGVLAAYDQLDCGLPTTYARDPTYVYKRTMTHQKKEGLLGRGVSKEDNAESNLKKSQTAKSHLFGSETLEVRSEKTVLDQLSQLSLSFLHAQSDGADVIVSELGGDIIFAKNPQILEQQWFWKNIFRCFIIGNDSMATIGAIHFLGLSGSVNFEGFDPTGPEDASGTSDTDATTSTTKESTNASLLQKQCKSHHQHQSSYVSILEKSVPFTIQFVASPFRTFDGAVSRAKLLGLPPVMNANSTTEELVSMFTSDPE